MNRMIELVGFIADINNICNNLTAVDKDGTQYEVIGPKIDLEKVMCDDYEVLVFKCYIKSKFVGEYSTRAVSYIQEDIPSNYLLIRILGSTKILIRRNLFLLGGI